MPASAAPKNTNNAQVCSRGSYSRCLVDVVDVAVDDDDDDVVDVVDVNDIA